MNEIKKYSTAQLVEELRSRDKVSVLKTLAPGEGVFIPGKPYPKLPSGTVLIAIVPDQKRD